MHTHMYTQDLIAGRTPKTLTRVVASGEQPFYSILYYLSYHVHAFITFSKSKEKLKIKTFTEIKKFSSVYL